MLAVQEKRSPLQRESKLADITGRRCHVSTTNILHWHVLIGSRWKGAVVQKMRRLEEAVAKIAAKVDMPELQALQAAPATQDDSSSPPAEAVNEEVITGAISTSSQSSQPKENHEPPQTWEVIMDPRGGPASIPASCVSESGKVGLPNSLSTARRPDLISTGLISLRQAIWTRFESHPHC